MDKVETKINRTPRKLILIKGAGDLATGVGHRLYRAGFKVVMTEQEKPTVIRRPVSFARAVFEGKAEVEGITAYKVNSPCSPENHEDRIIKLDQIYDLLKRNLVPVVVDPCLQCLSHLSPDVFIEATMTKKNSGVNLNYAPLVIALGPGFVAGRDVNAVVETKRGHYLGRVIYDGEALPNDGVPGQVEGYNSERLLRAPASGIFKAELDIGDMVSTGEPVGWVGDAVVKANISGVIRGLIQEGFAVTHNMKIGDIDPRNNQDYCFTISDKARAVGGGVLEAILALE